MFSAHHNVRRGFTLLEMLIVIGILTLLATVLITAIGSAGTRAKTAATRSLITKIQGLLNDRREAFGRLKLERQAQIIIKLSQASHPDYPGVTRLDLAKLIAAKEAYRGWFPQQESDLSGPDHTPVTTDDSPLASLLNSLDASGEYDPLAPSNDPVTESSELLYLALTRSSVLGGPTVGEDYFNTNEVKDTDGDGLKEFVDGWGNPLRFYRWPTRLIRPAPPGSETLPQAVLTAPPRYQHPINPDFAGVGFPAAPPTPPFLVGITARLLMEDLPAPPPGIQRGPGTTLQQELGPPKDPLSEDPDDPIGRFSSWMRDNNISESVYHAPDTYHAPLIVSAGPDGVISTQPDKGLGLYEPYQTANYGHLAQPAWGTALTWESLLGLTDNITNHNIRAGGN